MSTANTLYDETVVRGRGKLLQTQVIGTPTNGVFIVAPLADPAFDTFVIEWYNAIPSADLGFIYARISNNGGVSYDVTESYQWQFAQRYASHATPGVGAASWAAGAGGHRSYFHLTSGLLIGYRCNGLLTFFRGYGNSGIKQFSWVTQGWCSTSGYGHTTTIGSGGHGAMNLPNAIALVISTGTFTQGTFRTFGLRKGA